MDSTANSSAASASANNNTNVSQSSSSETNKKRNNNRRRQNNNKKKASASTATTAADKPTPEKNDSDETKKNSGGRHRNRKPKEPKEPLKGFIKPLKDGGEEDDDDDDDAEVCFICTRPIDYYAVAPCDHRTCHLCTLRLRVLYNTNNCAYCKAEAKQVIFTDDGEKPYESYTPKDTPFNSKKYGILFEKESMFKETMVLLQHNCPQQDCEGAFADWNELKRHVKQEHHRVLCDLCLRNKKIFSHEHTLYTQEQLHKHHREGDAAFNKDDETGFTGHPECVFCKTRFYGADELFEHCRDKHEQCHLCLRKGIRHQYYANYDNLEKHFKKEHFLCMYKECLDNKFVVFDSDIDLKAHEVNEHGNSLSRHQRGKQSEARRVDVNLNYGQPRGNNRQQPQQPPRNNQTINLSGEEFPDINGSTAPSPLASRMASVQLTEREHWPTLGEDNSSGRSSPNTANESDTGIVSRHAAALDQIGNILKNFDKVLKFRQLTSAFTSLSSDAETYVNAVYDLCGKDAELTAKVLDGAKDLVDNRTLKNQMVRFWNQKNGPSDTPRVLVVNPSAPSSNGRRANNNQKKKAGVWDKVASAAVDAGAVLPSFPPIHSKTPWSGNTTPRVNSEQDLQQLFPALPTSAGPSSRRADINAMLRKTHTNAWGDSSSSAVNTDSEYSEDNAGALDASSGRKKKGKKGKQVLFRVGL